MEASSTIDEQSILGTPITWEIIEKDFQEAYETTAKTGDKREAKFIGGGMGYVSKLTHVFFDWTTDHDRLPKEAVVKITIPVQMGPVRFENGPFELDDRKIMDDELLFYSRVGNLKFLPPKLKVPQFFCGRRYGVDGVNAGYISMEHIDGSIHRHLYHNVCKNGIFEAIDQLVELAVFSLKYPESLTDWPKFGRTLLDHFLAICDLDKKALQMIEKFPDLKEEIEKYVANYDKVYRDYKRFMEIRRKTCTSQILCQGDVWTPNILWDLDEEGRFHVRALVDWQFIQCHDVAWNQHFKAHIRQCYGDWMLLDKLTGGGKSKPKDYYLDHYLGWIFDVWDKLTHELTPKSFKESGSEHPSIEHQFPWMVPMITLFNALSQKEQSQQVA